MNIWPKRVAKSKAAPKDTNSLADYPLREYVASMASELATLARMDGDASLARALERAAHMAKQGAS